MKLLRTISTRSLLVLVIAVTAIGGGGTAIAVAASRGTGPTPPPKPLTQAIHDALAAPEPDGITARIRFANRLFPSGSVLGSVGSALMSGASGRLWMTNDGRGRIELQSTAGDAQIVWNATGVTVYDASSNTVYKLALPARSAEPKRAGSPPSIAQIGAFLKELGANAAISEAQPTNIAGRAAYSVSLAPKHDGGLLGAARLAWDAARGVPLRVAIYAQGGSSPVLELTVTEIAYGRVASSDVDVSAPAGATTVDLGQPAHAGGKPEGKDAAGAVSGLDAVKAAAGFPVVAPDTLVGLPRKDVRLVGGSDSKAVLVVYGQGLGAVVVVERQAEPSQQKGDVLSSLPTVSLDGLTGHELATQLGTVIQWQRAGVAYVLVGSLPPAAAEAAARALE